LGLLFFSALTHELDLRGCDARPWRRSQLWRGRRSRRHGVLVEWAGERPGDLFALLVWHSFHQPGVQKIQPVGWIEF